MRGHKQNVSREEKLKIAQFLLENIKHGTPIKDKINQAATEFGLSRKFISNIWAAARKQISEGNALMFNDNVQGPHNDGFDMDTERLKNLSFQKRSTYRRIAQ